MSNSIDFRDFESVRFESIKVEGVVRLDQAVDEICAVKRCSLSGAALCSSRFSMLTDNYPEPSVRLFDTWSSEAQSGIQSKCTTSVRLSRGVGYNTPFFGKRGLGEAWTNEMHSHVRIERGARYFGFDYGSRAFSDELQVKPGKGIK